MKYIQRKKSASLLIESHLQGITRALLDGEKRIPFMVFLNQVGERRGVYVLYNKGKIYYAGKASDLPKRLKDHLKDKHADKWDTMTLFFLSKSANVDELEGLLIAAAKPPGNNKNPKIGKDMRKTLSHHLKRDSEIQIEQSIYPEKEIDKLSNRITSKKLKKLIKKIGQKKLASTLGITQPYVSTLVNTDKKNLQNLRRFIREAQKRDAVLSLIDKS